MLIKKEICFAQNGLYVLYFLFVNLQVSSSSFFVFYQNCYHLLILFGGGGCLFSSYRNALLQLY